MENKTVSMPTALAWYVVNYQTENGLSMNHESKKFKEFSIHKKVFDPLFNNWRIQIPYSSNTIDRVLYEFLRPEIITQHPKILKCLSAKDAEEKIGKNLELHTKLEYKHGI